MNKQKELQYVKDFISYIEECYGRKVCSHKKKLELHPDCSNCQAQWALGWLRNHQSLIEWEIKQNTK